MNYQSVLHTINWASVTCTAKPTPGIFYNWGAYFALLISRVLYKINLVNTWIYNLRESLV